MRLAKVATAVVIGVIVLVGVSFEANVTETIIASSTFDSDDEGWTVYDIYLDDYWNGTTYIPDYIASGGNPGGYISEDDPYTNSFFFSAPAKFLGNVEIAYHGCLSFDWYAIGWEGGPILDATKDVILIGAGMVIYIDTPPAEETWSTQIVVLGVEAGWLRWDGDHATTDPPATEDDMRSVLASLDYLLIRGDHVKSGPDTGRLDNVILVKDCGVSTDFTSWGKIKSLCH